MNKPSSILEKIFFDDLLSNRQSTILRMRIDGKTLQEIGILFGVTRERVRQILTENIARKVEERLTPEEFEIYLQYLKELNTKFDKPEIDKGRTYSEFNIEDFKDAMRGVYFVEFPERAYEINWNEGDDGIWSLEKQDPPIKEYCFNVPLLLGKCFIKIYSSIDRSSGITRNVGEDAIRLVAADWDLKPIRPHFARINRVRGWKKNLNLRMVEILESLGNDMKCKNCGGNMILRKSNTNHNFLGCSDFAKNNCRGRDIIIKI